MHFLLTLLFIPNHFYCYGVADVCEPGRFKTGNSHFSAILKVLGNIPVSQYIASKPLFDCVSAPAEAKARRALEEKKERLEKLHCNLTLYVSHCLNVLQP